MKLADWMHERGMTPSELMRRLGLKSRTTVTRYLTGEREPDYVMLKKISDLTGKAVTHADFASSSPPRCAEVVELAGGTLQLVFPWTKRRVDWLALREDWSADDRGVPRVIEKAFAVLRGRAGLSDQHGLYVLDGRPIDARRLIMAANRVLRARGKPLLRYPGTGVGIGGER